ncbi:MAG: response regulator transcription factor [Pseudomonadota bacterium]
MSIHVFVVEDEPKVQKFVRKALEAAGMQVESTDNLDELEPFLIRVPFDVIVLDRLLGRRDSLPMVPEIKRICPEAKVLFLSALGDLDQRVSGLEIGADDYLAKPFHVTELVARVRALARRPSAEEGGENLLRFGDLEIRMDTQEVRRGGRAVPLTAKEFKLLTLLARKPRKVFSREELLDRVWGVNADPGSNVVEVTVTRLRSKLDEGGSKPLIHTKRGSGYWFGERNDQE